MYYSGTLHFVCLRVLMHPVKSDQIKSAQAVFPAIPESKEPNPLMDHCYTDLPGNGPPPPPQTSLRWPCRHSSPACQQAPVSPGPASHSTTAQL